MHKFNSHCPVTVFAHSMVLYMNIDLTLVNLLHSLLNFERGG